MADKFTFFHDRKVTIWERDTYEIEAGSYEEAERKFRETANRGDYEEVDGFIDTQFLYESQEPMLSEDNGDEPTNEFTYKNIHGNEVYLKLIPEE